MGSITQPGGGGTPPIIVTDTPADAAGATEFGINLGLPDASEWQVGDIFEAEFSFRVASINYATNALAWQLLFTDDVFVIPNFPEFGATGTGTNVDAWLRAEFVRITGVGSNVRVLGTIRTRVWNGGGTAGNTDVEADQLITVDNSASPAQADLLALAISADSGVDFSRGLGWARITLQ